jgi:NADPH:quinone reductase-like Zn-dependent oxidoreductase
MIPEKVPRPVPVPAEVLVEVHAAEVGPRDAWIRAGKSALPQPVPLTLGFDLSGKSRLWVPVFPTSLLESRVSA